MKNFILIILIILLSDLIFAQQNTTDGFYKKELNNTFNQDLNNCYGISKLNNGTINIEFPQKLRKDLLGEKFVVSLTPFVTWSALYVKEINEKGFVVKSESGDLNAKFFWQISPITNPEEKK